MSNSLILHIPHSSLNIPSEYRCCFSPPEEIVQKNLVALTDYATDILFDHPQHLNRLVFPVSRLLCDVERFINDADEIMASKGMGVVYTHGAFGEPLRSYDISLRSDILRCYYEPHHLALLTAVENTISKQGLCVIIDAHSFPSVPLPYDLQQSKNRPDFCIGTDDSHTPNSLINAVCRCIESQGYSVTLNYPYAGTIVPLPLLGTDKPVFSIMIEVNRKLYMNEAKQSLTTEFANTKNAVGIILDSIDRWTELIHSTDSLHKK